MNIETWTALGAIFAGIGVFGSIISPRIKRRVPPTRIEYVVQRNQNLLNTSTGADVEIKVDGRSVKQATVTILRIANTGESALPKQAWESPMEVPLPSGTTISARQTAARPSGLRIPIELRSDRLIIKPFLFNPGDLFDVQIITEGMQSLPTPHARIRDLKEVAQRRPVYNLGNGTDGALDKGNKVVYFVIFPVIFLLFDGLVISTAEPETRLPLFLMAVGVAGLYAWFLRFATLRNLKWRPAERF